VLNVLNLSLADSVSHYEEHCSGDLLRIDGGRHELLLDAGQKFVAVTLLYRLVSRIPTFVIEASDKHVRNRSLG